jgi:hypothetical protein
VFLVGFSASLFLGDLLQLFLWAQFKRDVCVCFFLSISAAITATFTTYCYIFTFYFATIKFFIL